MSSIRKSFWPTETDLFQELQKDPEIRRGFEERLRVEDEGGIMEPAHLKTSTEQERREGEIQELLERRNIEGEVVRSPVEVDDLSGPIGVKKSASGGNLHRRKFSVERKSSLGLGHGGGEEFEMQGRMAGSATRTRHSIDVLSR